MSDPYDRIINLLSTLSAADLKRLQRVLNDLVSTGYMPAQGHLEYRMVTRSGRQYGPYKYRRFWQNGKLVDQYEGKASAEEYQAWLAHKAKPVASTDSDEAHE
jgi:hypothetical protein